MLEKIPAGVGRALNNVRAGAEDLAIANTELTGVNASIEVRSPAFEYNAAIPAKYTADGEGVSPPLTWAGVPPQAKSIVLLVEDADSPSPQPLVHAIVWDLPARDGALVEGALPSAARGDKPRTAEEAPVEVMGRNSYLAARYLPPDPPPGHGTHRYVFQIFALDSLLHFDSPPGRAALLAAIRGNVIAKGLLIGTYERP